MEISRATSVAKTFKMQTAIETNIKASAEKIMGLLTDAAYFPKWNSTVLSIEGEIKQGNVIQLVSTLDPKRVFKLKVVECTPKTLVWKDGFPPIFSGTRMFILAPQPDGSTNFMMKEVFKGVMIPLIKSSLPDFKSNFEQYVTDLKSVAERN